MDEQRAKDLAMIEPPSSIKKIVEFTEQLSFGQDALFAGTELPAPPIGKAGFGSQSIASQLAAKPYSLFPGAGGEGLDSLMSRHSVRTRDIQDFTRWLMRWEDKRSSLVVYHGPEQYFAQPPEPESLEPFQYDPEVQRSVVEGRRRKRIIEEERPETEIEERVVKVKKTKQIREVEQEELEPAQPPKRRPFGGHPKAKPQEPDYGEYWREPAAKPLVTRGKAVAATAGVASTAAAAPFSPVAMLTAVNKGVLTSNLALGSLSSGVIQGRADAISAFQAQQAAASAVQTSPVAPYMQQPPMYPVYGQQQASPMFYRTPPPPPSPPPAQVVVEQRVVSTRYPQPEVSLQRSPAGPPPGVNTDWPGAPEFRGGKKPPEPQIFDTPDDYVVVPKKVAVERGIASGASFRMAPAAMRTAAAAVAVGGMMPAAFASSTPTVAGLPGMTGASTQVFAGQVMARGVAGSPGIQTLLIQGPSGVTAMPAGSVPRTDVFASGVVDHVQPQPMLRGLASPEPPVKTAIPANPLMGQITLVSGPMHVASQEAERSGSAVAIDVQQLAKSAGPLDATSLAMLKSALPPGAQAIYPALPVGSLGANAVNMPLAPSLLGQILTQGYGPQAAAMTGAIASSAAAQPMAAKGAGPLQASLVPIGTRPMDQTAGVLGEQKPEGPGALKAAGAANASRGGALDFLGMPVRLAPSLSGNAETRQAAEVRKVLPAGAAAVIRPNEFGTMKNKLFPSMSTVEAEPNKAAWRKAAPSFGLRDAEPHTILSPDARIKPPHESAPLPQLGDGTATPLTSAIRSAGLVAPAAAAAASAHGEEPAHPIGGALIARSLPTPPPAAGKAKTAKAASFGPLPNLGLAAMHRGPIGGATGFHMPAIDFSPPARPAGRNRGFSLPNLGALPSLPAHPFAPAAAGAAATASTRVASRFTPYHPSIGGGPTALVHESSPGGAVPSAPTEHSSAASSVAPIGMSQPGGLRSPAIPAVTPTGMPATPSMTASSYTSPSMARPATPTTSTGARNSLPTLSMPSSPQSSFGAPASTPMPTTSSSSLVSRAPQMPVAAATPSSRSYQQSQTVIQRAVTGGAVHANRTEHSRNTESTTNSSAQDPGASAHEIGLLANEVWSLLKRKLQFEADRLGRRY